MSNGYLQSISNKFVVNIMSVNLIHKTSMKLIPETEKIADNKLNSAHHSKSKSKSEYNKKATRVSSKIHPESALFTMIKLIVEHRDQINILDSVLSINASDLDLVQKLNYCMEFLAHIPFSFQYDKTQTRILLEYFHLEKEMQLIDNLEI